jgi:hypothetical protein
VTHFSVSGKGATSYSGKGCGGRRQGYESNLISNLDSTGSHYANTPAPTFDGV